MGKKTLDLILDELIAKHSLKYYTDDIDTEILNNNDFSNCISELHRIEIKDSSIKNSTPLKSLLLKALSKFSKRENLRNHRAILDIIKNSSTFYWPIHLGSV